MKTGYCAVALFLVFAIVFSGCVGSNENPGSDSQKSPENPGFFVTAEENIIKLHIFDGTIIENILSPKIFTDINEYPVIHYEMSYVTVPRGKENPLHTLKNTSETIYVISGGAEASVNGRNYTLSPGDTLYIPENAVQKVRNINSTDLSYLSLTYPPYNNKNEIILEEGSDYTKLYSGDAALIKNNSTAPRIFFENCEIHKILDPEILKQNIEGCKYNIGIAKTILPESGLTPPHILEGTTEVMYVISGEGILHVNQHTKEIKTGDTAYIPPGGYQSLENSGEEDLIYITITDPPYKESVDSAVSA
ncbi:mannose-6-phosphate isomerase-like protein (cupin superfamily) [Methanomicrobium sp. W14]|uniref:cupin domain-containing protein n=1 Tax=Methanomicrobium sp. W14 TaxID=2817839 RepID=UPI001AE9003E|nr:cupin domain-containing protein [Methanomicrobium sp. W14]MBP2133346.1 mannose-6-phosphate isomerase-like protein (cupin superfamily) [Methanomicrobium sp. W14]